MGHQRRKAVKKKCTSSQSHHNNSYQNEEQKVNDCFLDMSQACANCCSSIDSFKRKSHKILPNSSQEQSSTSSSNIIPLDDPSTSGNNVNKMLSTIYNLNFIPGLLEKYPDAISGDTLLATQVITDFPLCFLCTNLLKPLFSLYRQFNEIRKIESLLSKQIDSLNFLINYDGQDLNQQLKSNDNEADDDSRASSNSLASDEFNAQDTATITTSDNSSSRIGFQYTDPEPCVWVEIDPLDDLTVEEIGYAPPSLCHLYQVASQGTSSSTRRQETANQPENGQETSTSCHSNSTKLEFSSNDRGPWVKVGSRLEDLTIEEDCSSLTLDPNLMHEPLQSTLEFSKVFTIPPVVQDDQDNDHEMDPGHAPMTLPKYEQEAPPSNLAISDVYSNVPGHDDNAVDDDQNNDNDSDMNYEPSISSHDDDSDDGSDKMDDITQKSPQPDLMSDEDKDVKPDAADVKPGLGLDLQASEEEEEKEQHQKNVLEEEEEGHGNRRETNDTNETPGTGTNGEKEETVNDDCNSSSSESSSGDDQAKTKTMRKRKRMRNPRGTKYRCTVVLSETGQVCPFEAQRPSALAGHVLRVHPREKDKAKCAECHIEFKSAPNLKDHIRRMHSEKGYKSYKLKLEKCKERSKARTRETNAKGFACPHCGMDFIHKITLTVHLRTVHDDYTGVKNVLSCEVCGNKFGNSGYLRRHMQTVHSDARPFPCQICGRFYKTKETLQIHIHFCHNEEPRRKKIAQNTAILRRKKLQWQEELRKAGIEGNVCPHCGIDYYTKNKCLMHRRTVHDDFTGTLLKVVVCEVCGKNFEGKGRLKVHMQHVHSDERPFVCEECGRSYKSQGNLATHKSRFHTEEGKQKYNEYQRANLQRKKLIKKQMARKEEDEMEAETETSESDSESEQTRETAVITRSSTSTSSSLLPPPRVSTPPTAAAATLD